MSTSKNKANQRRVWEEIYNKGNLTLTPELFDANWVEHSPLGDIKGPEGFKQGTSLMLTAFPDIHVTVDDIFAEGDEVVTRFTATGTFKGEYRGITPTGKKFTFRGILITQWAGGKEVEAWVAYDMLTFYRQLGIPIPAQ